VIGNWYLIFSYVLVESFLVAILLTGIMRRRWKGFDGGEEAWNDIGDFFARLRERSREAPPREDV